MCATVRRMIKEQPTAFDAEKVIALLEEELKLADDEKARCIKENPIQFDSAKGYAHGIAACGSTFCEECLFCSANCKEKVREWSESEYIEVISKRDRAFLEYLDAIIHYVTRDLNDDLYIYISKPHKLIDCWESEREADKILRMFNIDLPMVKWSDSEPWLIEDLKKLEVVEEYE